MNDTSHRRPFFILALLATGCIFGLVGVLYFAIPGYPHIFAVGNATSTQPTGIAFCLALFLVSFVLAVMLTPTRKRCVSCSYWMERQAKYCAQCGCAILKRSA